MSLLINLMQIKEKKNWIIWFVYLCPYLISLILFLLPFLDLYIHFKWNQAEWKFCWTSNVPQKKRRIGMRNWNLSEIWTVAEGSLTLLPPVNIFWVTTYVPKQLAYIMTTFRVAIDSRLHNESSGGIWFRLPILVS